MITNLKFIFQTYLKISISILGCFFLTLTSYAQVCNEDLNFVPSTKVRTINWDVVPDFTLPFTNIYGGPSFYNSPQVIFRKGFSHLGNNQSLNLVNSKQQAIIYYGPAYLNKNQPWEILKSPYGNDLFQYEQKWRNDLLFLKSISGISSETKLNPDIFVFDIERQQKNNDSIFALASHSTTPISFRNLNKTQFLTQFKKDHQALYFKLVDFFKTNGLSTDSKISSYSDAPIWNVFANIQGNSWETWKTDKSLINYVTYDFDLNKVGGKFYESQSFLSPSAYYYFDYPSALAGDYLSYMLFQIEANKALSSKPIIPFIWLRYSFNLEVKDRFIRDWMAEASAIFPYFSGANGIWLWDDPFTYSNNEKFSTYEYFLKGQYRLSRFKSFFEGNYELVIDTPARVYNENRLPIWRGVVKDNNLLIAAHNPYPKSETEEVSLIVNYKNISKTIKLKGYEVYLCSFDLSLLGVEPNQIKIDYKVFPNPAISELNVMGENIPNGMVGLKIYDLNGRLLQNSAFENVNNSINQKLDISTINSSSVILQVSGKGFSHSKRIVISNAK